MNHNHALHQIEANIRAVGRQERTVLTQEAFELFISPSADEWLSFATPLLASPAGGSWATAVADLQAAFATHGRRPRLEYIADLHPALAPALEEGGLVCQSNNPVMWLETAELAPPPQPFPAARYQRLTAEDEPLLRAYLSQQSIAFGGTGGEESLGWLPTLQSGLAKGWCGGRCWRRRMGWSRARLSRWATAWGSWRGCGRLLNGAAVGWLMLCANSF
ncbi:MAG: hypothetical protein IPL28_11415 [Chloroflexi bacterium]|nr:hypothetical protein [Chloroflexota bacterium]